MNRQDLIDVIKDSKKVTIKVYDGLGSQYGYCEAKIRMPITYSFYTYENLSNGNVKKHHTACMSIEEISDKIFEYFDDSANEIIDSSAYYSICAEHKALWLKNAFDIPIGTITKD